MNQFLKSIIPNLPTKAGVYKIYHDKEIIYIGKAKNLQKRIAQYASYKSLKNSYMLQELNFVDYEITHSEASALLLESQLIKKFKPKYNILLKDDKSFPYIKLNTEHEFPRLIKFRDKDLDIESLHGLFFGPFVSASKLRLVLIELQKLFKLRSCEDSYFSSRTKPCIQYDINMCYAPCVDKITRKNYDILVKQVKNFFLGKNQKLQVILQKQMELLSSQMKFEEAALTRDKIKALNFVQIESEARGVKLQSVDALAIFIKNNVASIYISIYRNNKSFGGRSYIIPLYNLEENFVSDTRVLERFLIEFYQKNLLPKKILINSHIESKNMIIEALYQLCKQKVEITSPETESEKKLLQNFLINAQTALDNFFNKSIKLKENLIQLKKLFSLDKIPQRIEIYDNSHIQGAYPVGAMVVATENGFDKKEYRVFNISKDLKESSYHSDLTLLEQVLNRRFQDMLKFSDKIRPDFMIIDGGLAHKNLTKKIMHSYGIYIKFLCIAKGYNRSAGNENLYFSDFDKPFRMQNNLSIMSYFQVLRDQAHKFAISSHRKLRNKNIYVSSLDQIQGIGPKRKHSLISYFNSFQVLLEASVEDIAKVRGISKSLAKLIYDQIHSL